MSQAVDGKRKTFIASETAQAHLRWYISDPTTSPKTVSLCDASTPSIGVNEDPVVAANDRVTLLLSNASGTRKMVSAGAVTGGNKVYAAADGEVASSGTILEGTAFETVTTDQDILEVMATFGEDVDEDWADNETLEFGTGDDVILMWSTGDADNHTAVLGLGDTNEALHITDKAARATDWNVAAETHPTIYIHSNTTPATDYMTIGTHDGTTAHIDVVGGTTLSLDIAGTAAVTVAAAALTLGADDFDLVLGAGSDAIMRWSDGDADNHTLALGLGDSNQALHVTDKAAIATDWNVAADTHPTVYVHSNTTPATDYLYVGKHDGTTGYVGAVGGSLGLTGVGEVVVNEAGANVDFRVEGDTNANLFVVDAADEAVYIKHDDCFLAFGAGTDFQLFWSDADADNHSAVIALGDSNQALHITDVGAKATDWNVSAASHPEVFIHSNTTPATDYLRIGDHDGTEADIDLVGGTSLALKIAGSEIASVRVTGLAVGTYVVAGTTAGTDQLTLKSTGTAPSGTGANVGHIFCDYETDDDELFFLSGTVGTATQLTT